LVFMVLYFSFVVPWLVALACVHCCMVSGFESSPCCRRVASSDSARLTRLFRGRCLPQFRVGQWWQFSGQSAAYLCRNFGGHRQGSKFDLVRVIVRVIGA
jgi:hypothetical protein